MKNVLLICDNSLLEGATITCAQEQSIAPATNLLKTQPKDVFATIDANTTAAIDIKFAAQTSFDTIGLLHTNLTGLRKNNWLEASQDLDFATHWSGLWNGSGGETLSVTPDAVTAPDGTTTADKITAGGTGTSIGIAQNLPTSLDLIEGVEYTLSFYISRVLGGTETDIVSLAYGTGITAADIVSKKTITTDSTGAWTRESLTFTATQSTSSFLGIEGIGIGESGIYVWGAQLQAGANVTTYSPTKRNFARISIKTAQTQAELSTNPTFNSLFSVAPASPTDDVAQHHFFNYDIDTNFVGPLDSLWVRIEINDPDNVDGFFSVGRLFISNAFIPNPGIQYGSSMGYSDGSVLTETESALIPTELTNRKTGDIVLNMDSEEERSRLNEFLRQVGASKDVLVVTDASNTFYRHESMHHGFLQKVRTISDSKYQLYETRFSLIGLS